MIRTSVRIRGRISNSALVKEKDPRTWRHLGVLLVLVLVLALPILLGVAWQAEYVRAQYAIKDLGARRQQLDEQLLRLSIERASIESLDGVSRRALRELALVPGQQGLRIFVTDHTATAPSGIASAAHTPQDAAAAPAAMRPAGAGTGPAVIATRARATRSTASSPAGVFPGEDRYGARGGADGL